MKKLISFLKNFFSNPEPPDTGPDAETLRVEFQERYHHFKMLLNANNRALEIMTEIEQALSLKRPFGASFIRAKSTAITVSLLRLLKNLERLSGGKYNALYKQFDDICLNIEQIIEQKKRVKMNGTLFRFHL